MPNELKIYDLIGVPFVNGGRTVEEGFDCWGLCLEVFCRMGKELTDYRVSCYDFEAAFASFDSERAAWIRHEWPDVPTPSVVAIRFNTPNVNHVGVYVGDGKFLHTREKTGVCIERADSPAWRHRIEGFYTQKE